MVSPQQKEVYRDISEAAEYHKFGAVLEVTNGAGGNIGHKITQANNAKDFLDYEVRCQTGKKIWFANGLAYFISNKRLSRPNLNLLLRVKRFNDSDLERSLHDAESGIGLANSDLLMIERMFKYRDQVGQYSDFLVPKNKTLDRCAEIIKTTPDKYMDAISKIKGVAMEFYVFNLFSDAIAEPERELFHRVYYDNGENVSDGDVVIVCPQNRFYGALQKFRKRPDLFVEVLSRKR
ncbi:hypothetical protein GF345_01315 [Candidatus Woesearchaeota archaeon]|nr:hypothetical protein [Candidatus Woesearchaeota archaeon]